MKQLQIIRDVKIEIQSELKRENFFQRIRNYKKRIEFELSQKNFLQDIGDEYFIDCKDFSVYIAKDFWRVTLCIGENPISELYPKSKFEIFTILTILKKYI